jgi:hypothetical protein
LHLPSNTFPAGPLVLDASVLFNILATGVAPDILTALDVPCWVEERTAAEVRRMPGEKTESMPLLSLFDGGHLRLCRMSPTAYDIYLSLISGPSTETLDDGESAAIATCVTGLGSIVLDDKKARRVCTKRFGQVSVASSLYLIVEAARRGEWNEERLLDAIQRAREISRMSIVPAERAWFKSLCPG